MSTLLSTPPDPVALPAPRVPIVVRAARETDLPFVDALQKQHGKMVGWMPMAQLEEKIRAGQVLVAETAGDQQTSVGYVMGHDQYFKRDDVGIIYQMNIAPEQQRSLVGATLLKALFDRAAYGCRLFCCWCAQDIAANHFWEAMGFVPLAFRSGSEKKGRVHIFWQKRIREGDVATPFWFPSQTAGGSIREDRLVLPIPPGTHWSDAVPMVLPSEIRAQRAEVSAGEAKRLKGPRGKAKGIAAKRPGARTLGGWSFSPSPPAKPPEPVPAEPKPRQRRKNDPKLVAAARELRDRWLERVNSEAVLLSGIARYQIFGERRGAQGGAGSMAVAARERLALPAA